MVKQRIYVDMDGVVCDFVGKIIQWWNKDHGTNFTKEDIKSWGIEKYLGPGAEYFIKSSVRYPEFYQSLEPIAFAIDIMLLLQKDGFDVILATATPSGGALGYYGKVEWIRRYMPWFDLKNLVSIQRKSLLCSGYNDILIDDGEHNIKEWYDAYGKAIIFNQPWNKDFACESNVNISRCDNWLQVYKLIADRDYMKKYHE